MLPAESHQSVIGYWLVAAIVLIALLTTLIAVSRPDPVPPLTRSAPRPRVWFVWSDLATSRPAPEASMAADWIERIKRSLPPDLIVVRLPYHLGARAASFSFGDATTTPMAGDAITSWIGVRHVVESGSFADFESRLSGALRQLATTNAVVIVGNLPNITIRSATPATNSEATLLRFDQPRWNASIERIAKEFGFPVVDLSKEEVTVVRAEYAELKLTSASVDVIAGRFASPVATTLERSAATRATDERRSERSATVLTPTSPQSELAESYPERDRQGDA